MSLKKNLLKNGMASALQKVIRVAEQLLLVPFFISAWGAAYYGEWLTLTIIPSMLVFADLGFGTAAANQMVLQYASGDKQAAANTSRTGVFIISWVVVAGILLSFLVIWILDLFEVFNKSLIERTDAIYAVSLLMGARVLNFYQQLYDAYFRSARKASIGLNLQAIYAGLNLLGGIIVLITGNGVVAFASVNLLISLLFNPFFIIKARQVLPLQKEFRGQISRSEIQKIAQKGFGYLLSPIWQAIYFQGTTLAVRLTLGPLAVAVFNTVRALTRVVNQTFSLIIATSFPEFQFELGANNLVKARKLFQITANVVFLFAIIGIVTLYFIGPWFYQVWTHKELSLPTDMWLIFLIGIAFNSIWWTASFVFQALNEPYKFTFYGLVAALISVVITFLSSEILGLTGAALGSVALDLILSIYIFPRAIERLNLKSMDFFRCGFSNVMELFIKLVSNGKH